MIIIFLNELKNLTLSFLKINYLKDVADINIQKHCNNIYCEAETGRFNLAKNSFDLLLPNDNFNTKTYYYTILFIVVLLFIDLFYKFWKYNDRFVPYLSNVDGEYFITYLKAFPFILSFLVVFILTIMIVRRYAPTSSKGYKAYFNTDNDIIPDEIDSYNINVILEVSKNIIIIFVILYIFCGFFSAIPSVPYISRIDGINYFYFAMAYIFIVLLCFYMMVNIINITMTFTDNNKPNLEYINLPEILKSEVEELNVLSDDQMRYDIEYIDIIDFFNKNIRKIKISDSAFRNIANYFEINFAKFKGNIDITIPDIASPDIAFPDIGITITDIDKYFKENADKVKESTESAIITIDEFFKENANRIKESADNAIDEAAIKFYEERHGRIENFTTIENTINGEFTTLLNNELTILKKNSVTKDISIEMLKKLRDIVNKDDYFNNLNRIVMICNLTNLLIYKNLVNVLNKDLYNEYNINKSDVNNFKELYKDFLKQKEKINLFKDISHMKKEYSNIKELSDGIANAFVDKYKDKLTKCIELLNKDDEPTNNLLYSHEYAIFKNPSEREDSYTVDISYNSKNKYYENYFKISNGENIQLDYNVGNYQIKNMDGLLSYIIMFIVISLVLLLIVYNITTTTTTFNSYNIFTGEVISPLFILFIFILFIYIFINYNTKYNLHFINGVFDSSYKRDLTHLNNKIIPFISLHDKNADSLSNDYLDHYIITNIFTSIINGNLILYKDNDDIQINDDPLKIKDNFEDYVNISNRKIQYKLYNEVDTSNKVEFDSYYRKLFDNTYYYFEGDNKKYNNNTDSYYIYNLVKNIKAEKINNILTIKDVTADSINSYIKEVIDNYRDDIIDIIYICKHIFDPNNFKKEIATYNDNINDGHENKIMSFFSFELTENKMEASPYKFLLNLNTKPKYNEFLKYKNIFKISDDINKKACIFDSVYYSQLDHRNKEKYIQCNDINETNIATIVDNFLLINAHMKYNYDIINNYINKFDIRIDLTNVYNDVNDKDTFNEKINKLHNYENKRLFGLLKESLYKNDEKIIRINDTFRPTYDSNPEIDVLYQTFKYNYNMLDSYNSNTINVTNNYLKNVIKTIYKEINNEDINFINDSSNDNYKINISKSNLAKPVDTILHKANNVTGESLLINYITNIIIIIIMYNIGNNI